jgi:hypothetical protein
MNGRKTKVVEASNSASRASDKAREKTHSSASAGSTARGQKTCAIACGKEPWWCSKGAVGSSIGDAVCPGHRRAVTMVIQSSSRIKRVLENDIVRCSTVLRYFCSTCQYPLLFWSKNYTMLTSVSLERQSVPAWDMLCHTAATPGAENMSGDCYFSTDILSLIGTTCHFEALDVPLHKKAN